MATINKTLFTLEEAITVGILNYQRCPRCGAELRLRRVLNDQGNIAQDEIELFDAPGHTFLITRELLEKIRREKQCRKLDGLSTYPS